MSGRDLHDLPADVQAVAARLSDAPAGSSAAIRLEDGRYMDVRTRCIYASVAAWARALDRRAGQMERDIARLRDRLDTLDERADDLEWDVSSLSERVPEV